MDLTKIKGERGYACVIIQEVAGMCVWGGGGGVKNYIISKYSLFQLRSAVYTSGKFL